MSFGRSSKKNGAACQPDEGERWGCLVQDRDSRFVVACAVLGAAMEPTGTVHVERLNGAWRDRLGALTRKTHAFAKRDATWDALVGLQLFDHNFHRAQQALQLPACDSMHRYHQRSQAMVLGLTDHLWTFQEVLTARIPITP